MHDALISDQYQQNLVYTQIFPENAYTS